MPKIKFPQVLGETSTFQIKQTDSGYECYLDGVKIPAVISQELVIGSDIPHIVLKIVVNQYETDETNILLG